MGSSSGQTSIWWLLCTLEPQGNPSWHGSPPYLILSRLRAVSTQDEAKKTRVRTACTQMIPQLTTPANSTRTLCYPERHRPLTYFRGSQHVLTPILWILSLQRDQRILCEATLESVPSGCRHTGLDSSPSRTLASLILREPRGAPDSTTHCMHFPVSTYNWDCSLH